jgi:hypothetical protein
MIIQLLITFKMLKMKTLMIIMILIKRKFLKRIISFMEVKTTELEKHISNNQLKIINISINFHKTMK